MRSTPAGGRTLDTLIKSQVLYQLSYGSIVCGCKNTTFFETDNFFFNFFNFPTHSYLNALIGSVREAFKAGKKPEIKPKKAHDTKEITIQAPLMTKGNDMAKATT